MLQSLHVAIRRLVKQFLKCTPVVQATAYLRHEFVGNVHSKAAALNPAIKNMAKVLFAIKASLAVLSNAPRTAKTQRSESRWPKALDLLLKPIGYIYRKFFLGWHDVYVSYNHIYSQVNSFNYFQCSKL